MARPDDLRPVALHMGVAASDDDLERLAPLLETFAADLERLRSLPLADAGPAFTPRLSPREP